MLEVGAMVLPRGRAGSIKETELSENRGMEMDITRIPEQQEPQKYIRT